MTLESRVTIYVVLGAPSLRATKVFPYTKPKKDTETTEGPIVLLTYRGGNLRLVLSIFVRKHERAQTTAVCDYGCSVFGLLWVPLSQWTQS